MSYKRKKADATMYKKCNEELFAMVKTNEGIIIVCGKFKVSNKTFKTYKEAEEYVNSKPYEILINVAVLMCNLNQQQENENKEQNAKKIAADTKNN